jgi:hypothetical protein
MADLKVRDELEHLLDGMTPEMQEKVLDYARNLQSKLPKGKPGTYLLQFAGMITPEDAEAMRTAIEEGCETIDPDGW